MENQQGINQSPRFQLLPDTITIIWINMAIYIIQRTLQMIDRCTVLQALPVLHKNL